MSTYFGSSSGYFDSPTMFSSSVPQTSGSGSGSFMPAWGNASFWTDIGAAANQIFGTVGDIANPDAATARYEAQSATAIAQADAAGAAAQSQVYVVGGVLVGLLILGGIVYLAGKG